MRNDDKILSQKKNQSFNGKNKSYKKNKPNKLLEYKKRDQRR